MVALRSQGNWRWEGPLGTPLGLVRWKRASGTASINLNSRKSDGTYETIVLGDGQGSSSNKVVTAGEMSTALSAKADKSDTYTKAEVDTALSAKADTATTLAGYGITDAYTKTEADTLLGAKAPTTALTDGSVTKVGTANVGSDTMPIKLVAGVPTAVGHDLMTLDTAQVVTGSKQLLGAYTFKKFVQTFGGATAGYRKLWTFSGRGVFNMGVHSTVGQYRAVSSSRYLVELYRATFDSTDNKQTRIYSTADTSSEMMVVGANINPAEGEGGFAVYGYMVASATAEFLIDTAYNEDGTFKTNFAESNDSTVYSLATIGAIVPVADPMNLSNALDGYLPMVRTTGNQTIGGIKTTTQFWQTASSYAKGEDTRHASNILRAVDKNNSEVTRLLAYFNTDGSTEVGLTYQNSSDQTLVESLINLAHRVGNETIAGAKTFTGQMLATGQRAYSAGNTTDVATIGTLDAYTPMVRTTGNQSISGVKIFSDGQRFTFPVRIKSTIDDVTETAPASDRQTGIEFEDKNGKALAKIALNHLTDGTKEVAVYIYDKNEVQHKTILATYTDS